MKRPIQFVSTSTADIPPDVWQEAELYAALGFEEGEIENDGQRYQWAVQHQPEREAADASEQAVEAQDD